MIILNKKEQLAKGFLYFSVWWLFVMVCTMIGDARHRSQPHYEVWEDDNRVISILTGRTFFYIFEEDDNGLKRFYVEAEDDIYAFYYIDSKTIIITEENMIYKDLFTDIFETLFYYYGVRLVDNDILVEESEKYE